MLEHGTLVDVIESYSRRDDEKGITFISGDSEETYVSYKNLYHRALGLLHNLQARGITQGDELIFQLEDNESFLYTYWACLLGGIVPVPVTPGNNEEHRFKLYKIWKILNHPYLITEHETFMALDKFMRSKNFYETLEEMKNRTVLVGDITGAGLSIPGTTYKPKLSDIAFVQFSSGSTGDPKGVILTHGNLLVNTRALASRSEISPGDSMLSWMPLTHDMGMIVCHLTSFISHINQYIMPTALFIRRPTLWLKKTNEHKATLISSPNFGYRYFLSFFKPEIADGWDLSRVRVIYNGAEPVSAKLCYEFLDTMASWGLNRNSMCVGYGMAEATVDVSVCAPGEGLIAVHLDRECLNIGRQVRDVDVKDSKCVTFVDVGYPVDDCYVRICDEAGHILDDNVIGHIQIKGKNVTCGYYNNTEATEKTIASDGWLSTGDLGFMRNGRLVVTGRAKDIIFVNGLNYYPHDIERAAEDVEGIGL